MAPDPHGIQQQNGGRRVCRPYKAQIVVLSRASSLLGRWPGPSIEAPGGWGAEKSEASPMDRAERQRSELRSPLGRIIVAAEARKRPHFGGSKVSLAEIPAVPVLVAYSFH